MAFSSVIGASSVIKPGVVTSSTRPSVPFVGQLIFESDTNRLAAYNGSAWVTQNGLQLITAQTIGSAVSSVPVSNVFSAAYDDYKIIVSGGVASTDLALNLTLGATATGYYSSGFNQSMTAATINATNTNNGTSFTSAVYCSTNALSGEIHINNPFSTKRTMVRYQATGTSTTYFVNQQQGFLNDANSYTGFTLTCSTGTITGGTICVYGYAKV
jgi:hypothetical protein